MGTLYEKTKEVTQRLEMSGYKVIEMWEHDFRKLKKNDADLVSFLSSHNVVDKT